jgi:hypothetical protein
MLEYAKVSLDTSHRSYKLRHSKNLPSCLDPEAKASCRGPRLNRGRLQTLAGA